MQGIEQRFKTMAMLLALVAAPALAADVPVPADAATEVVEVTPAQTARMQARLNFAISPDASADRTTSAAAFDALLGDPSFPELPLEAQALIYSLAGTAALDWQDQARARDMYLQAITANSNDSEDWSNLSWVEYRLHEYDAAGAHMAELARRWPEVLDGLHDSFLYGLLAKLDGTSPARLDLLQSLASAGWGAADLRADHLWLDLALLRVQRGEHDLARAAIEQIAAPNELVQLRSDRRFDGLFDLQSPRFDVALVARQRLERLSTLAAASPLDLELADDVARALRVVGEFERSVSLVEATLQLDAKDFIHPEAKVWLLNSKAMALEGLGRFDEALAVMQLASTLAEDGSVNVSQSINLGEMHCARGNWRKALAALEGVGEVSDYGRMAVHSVRHCARLRQGDRAGADESFDYLQEHRALSTTLYLKALLHEERMDDAAASLIGALDSGKERAETLGMVQDYLRTRLPAEAEAIEARRRALLLRDDVGAAIERVGRRQHYGIHEP